MKVITSGRTDLNEYFSSSGIREYKELNHTPFLVFLTSDNTVEVRTVANAKKLLDFPDDTPVMNQWRGKWRSDFFQFRVQDFRKFIFENPPKDHYLV